MIGLGVMRAGRKGVLMSIALTVQWYSPPPVPEAPSPEEALYDTAVRRYSVGLLYACCAWPDSLSRLPGAASRRLPLPENCSYLTCNSSIRAFAYCGPSSGL